VDTKAGLSFALNNPPGYSELTALFDRYRLTKVQLTFIYGKNSANITQTTTAGANTNLPCLYTAIDLDDDSAPANIDELLEYETCHVDRLDKIVKRTVYPRIATAAYSGAFTSYANMDPSTWIDCNSDGVRYYGLKYVVRYPSHVISATDEGELQIIQKHTFQFKDVR